MRPLLALTIVALGACTPANSPAVLETPQTTHIGGGGGGDIQVTTAPTVAYNVTTISAPLETVWRAMPLAYDSLGIATNTVDPKSHTIGNTGFKIRRQLGKVALSKYLDCGKTQGSQGADTYEVLMSVVTQLTPGAGGTTTVTTTVDGQGRPVTMAGEYSRCISNGVLEPALAAVARARAR